MKLLLVAPIPPPYGGIANWSKMITEYAACNKPDLEIKTFNIAPKKRSTEGRTLFDRIVISGFEMLKKNRKLKKELKYNKPDIIHMTTSGQLAVIRDIMFIKTAKKFNVPIVYHIRFGKTKQIAEKGGIYWKLYSCALKSADSVVVIDKSTYDSLRKRLPDSKAELMPNPVNVAALPYCDENPEKKVVFLGWVVPTKGVTELIEAWNDVGKEFTEYELLIVGQYKKDYYEQLVEKIRCPNVKFLGEKPHSEAMNIVSRSSVFVLPSYTEGFPNSVVEAMALKKAIIATRVGAIPEMLSDNCGILIDPQDKQMLAYELKRLLSDSNLRLRIENNAHKKALVEYDISVVFEKYKKLWTKLIRGE